MNDETIRKEILNHVTFISFGKPSSLCSQDQLSEVVMAASSLVDLVRQYARAHAEIVIGADVAVPTGPRALGKTWALVGNRIRAEQRERNR